MIASELETALLTQIEKLKKIYRKELRELNTLKKQVLGERVVEPVLDMFMNKEPGAITYPPQPEAPPDYDDDWRPQGVYEPEDEGAE